MRAFLKNKKRDGFTLVEVLVSAVIIAIVSIGSYVGFYVLSGASESARNQLHAIAFAQETLEEVRTVAQISFDTLNSSNFPDNIDQARYPGFHRNVVITPVLATTHLKKIDVTISWTGRNGPSQYNLALFLSRPPEPLPANIHGTVSNNQTQQPVQDAKVDIVFVTQPTLSAMTYTITNGFYTFVDSAGNPRLKPGDWTLRVTRNGYYDFATVVRNLDSGEDRAVDVALEPKPAPAYIRGRTVDITQNNKPISVYINLYENASVRAERWSNGSFEFRVDFDDANPRSFTLATSWLWMMRMGYCGNFPDCQGWGKRYNYMGWSSSVARTDGQYVLTNPWYGNSQTDRLTVNPGDNLDVGDIPFVPVPPATLRGYIYDSQGNPVPGKVYVSWHLGRGSSYACRYYGYEHDTKPDGSYEISVPAEQALFPDHVNYYLNVLAGGGEPIEGSCGDAGSTWVYSDKNWERAGPLPENGNLEHNFRLKPPPGTQYGNAAGSVIDGKIFTPVSGVDVGIWGWKQTDSGGVYDFSCSPEQTEAGFFMIPIGSYKVEAKKSGYYAFNSNGNAHYSVRRGIYVQTKQTATYEQIKLWPAVVTGTVTGKVIESGVGGKAIVGAKVNLEGPQTRPETSGGDGRFTFSNLPETWPPSEMDPEDTYYKHEPANYYIKEVKHTDAYEVYGPTLPTIILNEGNNYTFDVGDIALKKKDQF